HSHSCIGDEAPRPARSRRKRKAHRARQSASGRPAEAGGIAPPDRKPPTPGGGFALRSSSIFYLPSIPIEPSVQQPLQPPRTAETSIDVAPMNQQNGAWAGTRLGTSPTETIGSAGCAITAVAMMLQFYDINPDPGVFNAWLTANGGYAFDDMLIWNAVTAYSGGRVTFSGWLGPDLGV